MDAFFESIGTFVQGSAFCTGLAEALRFVFPLLAGFILYRCARSLLFFKPEPEIWAWLAAPNGERIPVTHWENLLGRAKNCDVVLDYPTISRQNAVLTRYDDGSWSISDVGSKGGVAVNGESVSMSVVDFGDRIALGGVEFVLVPITPEQERIQASVRTRADTGEHPWLTPVLLTVFQLFALLTLLAHGVSAAQALPAMLGLVVLQWLLFGLYKLLRRSGFEVESLAFFLCTMGLCVIASSDPSALKKELLAIAAGVVFFLVLGLFLRNLERVKRVRYLAAAFGIALLAFNLVFGVEKFGAKNWVQLGSFSFQPSELVKICFVFAGASTLQRLMTRRNQFLFIAYSAAICGCLALMSDFGTAIIFFCTFLVIAFLRSGDFATLALACAGTGFAGVFVLKFKPYAMRRFAGWGHVWENSLTTGYQQTRAMMCIASGGLFGLGAGRGWLKYVGASDTDLVFAFVGEEWGLLMSLLIVAALVILVLFVIRSLPQSRSSFYSIGAAAAATILIVQAILNLFGTVDFLPLTGVTFPFVSNGGSSMLCVWGLLAFIKAVDTRQNASFAIRLPSGKEARA